MPETTTRRITVTDGAALLGGLVSGAIGAYAYYSPSLRPLAHAFTLWIALLAAVVPGARDARAIARAVVALATAVVAFYCGKDVMYGIKYPGMPYSVNAGSSRCGACWRRWRAWPPAWFSGPSAATTGAAR
ncbi:hypothetical protein [Amycolatopsis sp. NPDC004625]|uniref:hypothetical protein n=1 Tax=Amycolatopsis sp. NPDC004625 TaxID=3154670 RepID=UPI0033B53A58